MTQATAEWVESGEGTEFRPPSQRFTHPKLFGYTVAVSPITAPNLERFGGDYGNVPVAYTVDTETLGDYSSVTTPSYSVYVFRSY